MESIHWVVTSDKRKGKKRKKHRGMSIVRGEYCSMTALFPT